MQNKLKKFTSNTAWIIAQNVYTLALTVIVGAFVARYFGPAKFGEFNYASSIVALFSVFSTLGLTTLTVKSLLDKEYDEGTILCSSFVLRVVGGLVLCVISAITVRVLQPSDLLLQTLAVILSSAMVFKATDVVDYWAQAHLKSKIISIARMISLALTSSYKLYVVFSKGTIVQYAFAAVIDAVIVGVILIVTYFLIRTDKTKWKFNIAYVSNILKKCWYIIISGLMITVYVRIDQIMLGSMITDKTASGLYAAALNVAQMWYFVPSAMIISFQAIIMGYHANGDVDKYNYHMQGLYTIVFYMCFGFALVISILSPILIAIIYGSAYAESSSILVISIWGSIFAMLGSARDVWLICEGLQKYTLVYSFAGCLTNVVLNLFLIPAYGAYGAAVATVIAQFGNIVILLFFIRGRKTVFMMLSSLSPGYLIDNYRRLIPLRESS